MSSLFASEHEVRIACQKEAYNLQSWLKQHFSNSEAKLYNDNTVVIALDSLDSFDNSEPTFQVLVSVLPIKNLNIVTSGPVYTVSVLHNGETFEYGYPFHTMESVSNKLFSLNQCVRETGGLAREYEYESKYENERECECECECEMPSEFV
jgi:hypothetical protein